MAVKCETRGSAGRRASMDQCVAESGQCKWERSLNLEIGRTVPNDGYRLLATVRSQQL